MGHKPRKRKHKSGTPFEIRARDAMAHVFPGLDAKHNEQLEMAYGTTRQFDVTVRSTSELRRVYEAKDHGSRVPFEKVEAFDTKVRELAVRPTEGAGLISAEGFQSGPILRAQRLSNAAVSELYQLRDVEDSDWDGYCSGLQITAAFSSIVPVEVSMKLRPGVSDQPPPLGAVTREQTFLLDENGFAVGNALDDLNRRIREVQAAGELVALTASNDCVVIGYQPGTYIRTGDTAYEVEELRFQLMSQPQGERVAALDVRGAVRDTLIDCVGGQKWLIPNPNAALVASRNGYSVALSYAESSAPDLEALAVPVQEGEPDENAELMNALQIRMLLASMRGADELDDIALGDELRPDLAKAWSELQAGDLGSAEALYWDTCGRATSLVALSNLTYIYDGKNDLDQALRLAYRTIELFPLEVHGWINAIATHLRRGEVTRALDVLAAAKIAHAGDPRLTRQEADALYRAEDYAGAARRFAALSYLQPENWEVRYNLALCQLFAGRVLGAVYDVRQALKLAPDSDDLVERAVWLLLRASQPELAAETGRSFLRCHKTTSTKIPRMTGTALHLTRENEEAFNILSSVDFSGDREGLFALGCVEFERGNFADADRHFQKALQLAPDFRSAIENSVTCRLHLRDYRAAQQALNRATSTGCRKFDPGSGNNSRAGRVLLPCQLAQLRIK